VAVSLFGIEPENLVESVAFTVDFFASAIILASHLGARTSGFVAGELDAWVWGRFFRVQFLVAASGRSSVAVGILQRF